jgi:3D (Asp-Asp-Asp) domain-containing protein
MEQIKVLRVLAHELRSGTKREREVASVFLKAVLLRKNESLYNKAFAAYHLFMEWLSLTYHEQRILVRRGHYKIPVKDTLEIVLSPLSESVNSFFHNVLGNRRTMEAFIMNMVSLSAVVILVVFAVDWNIGSLKSETTPDTKKASKMTLADARSPVLENSNFDESFLMALSAAVDMDDELLDSMTEEAIDDLLSSGRVYDRNILVTGYYSPLPDQEYYATGSYWGDIKLNGRGVLAYDETPVYLGMAAGPPYMGIGTKVIIRDLETFDMPAIYTVHDRGSAIKGNRLDIWMGYGVEAMEKAYDITGYYRVTVVE